MLDVFVDIAIQDVAKHMRHDKLAAHCNDARVALRAASKLLKTSPSGWCRGSRRLRPASIVLDLNGTWFPQATSIGELGRVRTDIQKLRTRLRWVRRRSERALEEATRERDELARQMPAALDGPTA